MKLRQVAITAAPAKPAVPRDGIPYSWRMVMQASSASDPSELTFSSCKGFQPCDIGLAELGVTTPIGIANTAIGGQHIEEFMINTTITTCSETAYNVTGHDFGVWGNSQVFGSQVVPFVDMTIKGFVWYQVRRAAARAGRLRGRPTLLIPHPLLFPHPQPNRERITWGLRRETA